MVQFRKKKRIGNKERYVRLRTWESNKLVDLHLIECDGGAEQCRMYGKMPAASAEKIAEWFRSIGVRVVREHRAI